MTDQLGGERTRADFDEESGTIIDKILGENSTTNIITTYTRQSVILDGVDDKIIFPTNFWDTSSDFSGYIAYKYLGSSGTTEQFWTMDPNAGDKPVASWNGVTQDFFWSASVTGSGNVVLANGANLDPTDLIVQAFSYKLSTRLVSMSVESSSGISLSGTNTETSTATGNGPLKLGANGPNSAFTNMEIFQVGTYTTVFDTTDLTDTATALLNQLLASGDADSSSTLLLLT